jgi:hypothetical protein
MKTRQKEIKKALMKYVSLKANFFSILIFLSFITCIPELSADNNLYNQTTGTYQGNLSENITSLPVTTLKQGVENPIVLIIVLAGLAVLYYYFSDRKKKRKKKK